MEKKIPRVKTNKRNVRAAGKLHPKDMRREKKARWTLIDISGENEEPGVYSCKPSIQERRQESQESKANLRYTEREASLVT